MWLCNFLSFSCDLRYGDVEGEEAVNIKIVRAVKREMGLEANGRDRKRATVDDGEIDEREREGAIEMKK